jgi:CHAT domain-containing protein
MGRMRIILAIFVFVCGILCLSADIQAVEENEDSLRVEIQHLLDEGKQIYNKKTTCDTDSAYVIFGKAANLARQSFGEYDSLHVWSLYWLIINRLRLCELQSAESHVMMMDRIMDSVLSENLSYPVNILTALKEYYSLTSDIENYARTIRKRLEFLKRSQLKTYKEKRALVAAMKDLSIAEKFQGNREKSRQILQEALKLAEETLGRDDGLYGSILGHIALDLRDRAEFEAGSKLIRESNDIVIKAYGPEQYLSTWNSLLLVEFYRLEGDIGAADSLLNLQLEIFDRTVGESHIHYLIAQNKKAQLLVAKGEYAQAVREAHRLVQLSKARSKFPTAESIESVIMLGMMALPAGDYELFAEATMEISDVRHTFLMDIFRFASESQKLGYVRIFPPIDARLLSGAVKYDNPLTVRAAIEMILNGKGLAVDALAAQQTSAMCSENPYLDSLMYEYGRISSNIAGLAFKSAGKDEILEDMYSKRSRLEKEISNVCADTRLSDSGNLISIDNLLSYMPENSVLLDFVKYEFFDYENFRGSKDSHYVATVISHDDSFEIIDLGNGNIIDSLIIQYRDVMSDALQTNLNGSAAMATEQFMEVATELYEYVVTPLKNILYENQTIFVAPDGLLNLIPFETLTKDGERYLIEDHRFVYLTSGRDFLKDKVDLSSSDAFVLADPDYMIDPTVLPVLATSESVPMFAYRGNSATPECLGSMFSPLPMTRQEGTSIADLLGKSGLYDITYLESDQAREGVLKNLDQAPDILHIATHGYFCERAENAYLSSPLLRSGLILAGANRTIGEMNENTQGDEDGILTAMEVSGLNLIGTDLVVLSACQTGIGDVQNGEGVFGLRRAFQHAGAKSVVMSMFAVPDESTSDLMERFYENWLSGQSKSSALRDASLSILNERRNTGISAHPLFWGGFILVGDPE